MKKISVVEKKYPVNGINLNVATMGNGDDLVFVHGWSNNWFGWMPLAEELAPNYKVHLLDLPGFGDSDPLEEYSIEIVSEYVAEYYRKYAPQAKALIGGSLGTFVVAEAARKHSLKVPLILIGTVVKKNKLKLLADMYQKVLVFSSNRKKPQDIFEFFIRHPYTAYVIERFFHAYKFDKKLVDTYQVPGRKKVLGKTYVQIGVSATNYVIEDVLKENKNPVLLLFGKADRYISPVKVETLVNQVHQKNVFHAVVEKAGHSPAYEHPKQTAQLITTFLNSL